jgi:hypothetical protein
VIQPGDVREAASGAAREVTVELQLGSSSSRDRCRGTTAVVSCGWSSNGGELQMEQQRW